MNEPIIYMGQRVEQGRIIIEPTYPREGYAVIRCGGTEVQVGYTLLHNLRLELRGDHPYFAAIAALQKALYAITAEAANGQTGDARPSGERQPSAEEGR